uniref:Uncharacterized protein n=1 Tax=Cyclophora tenuis TaxID=216820 RepID=A0A7S1CZ75_CYCTE
MLESGEAAQLFTASFGNVPNVERMADWIATKWAPAVLRTFDLSTIRIGERPVFAARAGPGQVKVVWQMLDDDFSSVTVGQMMIKITETELVATRAPGDASKGYGEISRKPLQGESVLVRRLADAASQAVEKGLAERKKVEVEEPVVVTPPKPATPVETVSAVDTPPARSLDSGPRQAGARRSARRARGTRKEATESKPKSIQSEGIDTSSADSFQ